MNIFESTFWQPVFFNQEQDVSVSGFSDNFMNQLESFSEHFVLCNQELEFFL